MNCTTDTKTGTKTATAKGAKRGAKVAKIASAPAWDGADGRVPSLALMSDRPAASAETETETAIVIETTDGTEELFMGETTDETTDEPTSAPKSAKAPKAPASEPKIRRAPGGWKVWIVTAAVKAEQTKIGAAVKASGKPAPVGTKVHLHRPAPGSFVFVVAKTWVDAAPGATATSEEDAVAFATENGWEVVSGTM